MFRRGRRVMMTTDGGREQWSQQSKCLFFVSQVTRKGPRGRLTATDSRASAGTRSAAVGCTERAEPQPQGGPRLFTTDNTKQETKNLKGDDTAL